MKDFFIVYIHIPNEEKNIYIYTFVPLLFICTKTMIPHLCSMEKPSQRHRKTAKSLFLCVYVNLEVLGNILGWFSHAASHIFVSLLGSGRKKIVYP